MRWFGPHDTVSLKDLRQAGSEGIVTALHQIPVGETWPIEAIEARKRIIEKEGMQWAVVESLPVSEDIKRQSGHYLQHIENYKQSLRNLAQCGIKVITYNFMPVLDWVRTNHQHINNDGTRALAFNRLAFVYADIELLSRPNAKKDFSVEEVEAAMAYGNKLSAAEKEQLFKQVLLGLPGSTSAFTRTEVLSLLKTYKGIDANQLRANLIAFLEAVIPVAEKVGAVMAIHPDDPPYSILGLPRIMCTEADAAAIFSAVPSIHNGLCYCTGSFGAHPSNNLMQMLNNFADRIHFLHLRSVAKAPNGDFKEAAHLAGDAPMPEIIEGILNIMVERDVALPMRPDHGFLHDIEITPNQYPGYSLVGRMKGLAELSGLETGLIYKLQQEKLNKEFY